MHLNEFGYGPLTPILAFAASYLGCLLGLMCAGRARVLTGAGRRGWLVMTAIALGGTGLWVMHFIATLGFDMGSTQLRYQMVPTVVSVAVAILAVGVGLAIAGNAQGKVPRVVGAGVVTGVGAAVMHHLGMMAIVMPGVMTYNWAILTVSLVIAVLASVLTMWFIRTGTSRSGTLLAPILMAVGYCGMHYVAMMSMRMDPRTMDSSMNDAGGSMDGSMDSAVGVTFTSMLLPLLLIVSISTVILLVFVAFSASPEELVDDAQFEAQLQDRRARELAGTSVDSAPALTRLGARRTSEARSDIRPGELRSGGSRPRPVPRTGLDAARQQARDTHASLR